MKSNGQQMGQGTCEEWGYRVEARDAAFAESNPIVFPDGILGSEFREIHFSKDYLEAIPTHGFGLGDRHDLLEAETAVALAWTIIAQHPLRQIECRLTKFKLTTTYNLEKAGIVDMVPIKNLMFNPLEVEK